jgi:hypothetical protein
LPRFSIFSNNRCPLCGVFHFPCFYYHSVAVPPLIVIRFAIPPTLSFMVNHTMQITFACRNDRYTLHAVPLIFLTSLPTCRIMSCATQLQCWPQWQLRYRGLHCLSEIHMCSHLELGASQTRSHLAVDAFHTPDASPPVLLTVEQRHISAVEGIVPTLAPPSTRYENVVCLWLQLFNHTSQASAGHCPCSSISPRTLSLQ